jgi:nitronate monooxygenase
LILDQLDVPIVLAPLAGGPTTPQLAASVANAGGLGFLAAGYLTAAALAQQIRQARELTTGQLGVNVFVPGAEAADHAPVTDYAAVLAAEAQQAGVELGLPRFDDDDWDAKLALLTADPLPVTSFTFGCPEPALIQALQAAGSEVWVTVTTPAEAVLGADAGADALVVQGSEAGGHRGSFIDDPADDASGGFGLLSLLQLVRGRTSRPVVAAGGIGTGAAVAAVLAVGAAAAQIGTAFLRCPEAGTSQVQRAAVASAAPTAMTRAFTGRNARGIRNRFMDGYNAPAAYPEVHYLTAPLRAAGRRGGDPDLVNLWAGQTHELSRELPAADLVAELAQDARASLAAASRRLGG